MLISIMSSVGGGSSACRELSQSDGDGAGSDGSAGDDGGPGLRLSAADSLASDGIPASDPAVVPSISTGFRLRIIGRGGCGGVSSAIGVPSNPFSLRNASTASTIIAGAPVIVLCFSRPCKRRPSSNAVILAQASRNFSWRRRASSSLPAHSASNSDLTCARISSSV
jgi:hypothetical protein